MARRRDTSPPAADSSPVCHRNPLRLGPVHGTALHWPGHRRLQESSPRYRTTHASRTIGSRILAGRDGVNFLAHALLSPEDDEIRAGNVCADLIKGRVEGITPPRIAAGVALHRAIDRFADRHHAFRACMAYVAAPRRRYAGVVVDIFFDHCLARCWTRYSAVSLDVFVERVCTRLEQQADRIPVRDRARFMRMLEGRWLGVYATRAGLERVFAGLARRARFGHGLGEAATDLDRHYAAIEAAFHVLMPALREHASREISNLTH